MKASRKKSKPERVLMRVVKGGIVPADGYTAMRLREKGYAIGDILLATFTKPRNPKFHRMAHRFGKLCADNIVDFDGMAAHDVIKRMQYEANIECNLMGVRMPGVGFVEVRIPRSLSFASMDEGAFKTLFRSLARYVAENYWPDLSEDQIAEMAEVMPDE